MPTYLIVIIAIGAIVDATVIGLGLFFPNLISDEKDVNNCHKLLSAMEKGNIRIVGKSYHIGEYTVVFGENQIYCNKKKGLLGSDSFTLPIHYSIYLKHQIWRKL